MPDTARPRTLCEKTSHFLDVNLLTLFALALVGYALFGVPQVFAIWWEGPRQIFSDEGAGLKGLGFIPFVFGTFAFYAAAWLVIRSDSVRQRLSTVVRTRSGLIGSILAAVRFVLYGWVFGLANRMTGARRLILGSLMVAVAVIVEIFAADLAKLDRPWPLAGMMIPSLAVLIAIAGLWLLLVEGRVKQASAGPMFAGLAGLLGRFLGFTFFLTLVGEVIWGLAYAIPGYVSYRVYTIWAVFHVSFLILALATVLDVWHEEWKWPIRQLTFAFLALYTLSGWFLTPDPVGQPVPSAQVSSPNWYATLDKRVQATHPDAPLIVVAASGGGSRAAYFTALVYEALKQQPLHNSAGEELWLPKNEDNQEPRPAKWADQIIMISSVSGGSLATAYHVHSPTAPLWGDARDLRNSFGTELKQVAGRFITGQLPKKDIPKLPDIYQSSWKEHADYDEDPVYHGRVDAAIAATPQVNLDTYSWMIRNRFGDDMCTDFMAPLLRGFMTPRGQRGIALSRFWEQKFGWQNSDNQRGYDPHGYGKDAPPPLVLFNATHVQSGSRQVIGFPPLPERFFNRKSNGDPKATDLLADGSEYHTLAISDFDPAYRVSLAEAARLSANFPWGVRSAQVSSESDAARHHFTDGRLTLIDGGVNDNTGILTLADVFSQLEMLARSDAAPKEGTPATLAQTILKTLRRRGVIFIEIDSGAKPSVATLPELRTPAQGLENAGYANASRAKHRDLDLLERILTPLSPVKELVNVGAAEGYMWQKTFQCNHTDYEVMTAWALPPTEKAKILATFFWEYRQWSEIELQGDFQDWLRAWKAQAHKRESPPIPPTSKQVLKPLSAAVREKERLQMIRREGMAQLGK